MLTRVTLADCAARLGDFLDGRLDHAAIVEWSRDAMLASEMPLWEQAEIMDLLQDISRSTPAALANAAKNYRLMNSPLVKGTPMDRRRN